MNDIRRKVELWICAGLTAALPGQTFAPAKGGDDQSDEAVLEPPYTSVAVTEAKNMIEGEDVWHVECTVTYVTQIDDSTSPQHSIAFRAICDAVRCLPRGYFPAQQLGVSGLDISGIDDFDDSEGKSHGDVITLSIGASG